MYACNGILFNHESPRRGETFVTRLKITRGLTRINAGLEQCIYMGNLDSKRDSNCCKRLRKNAMAYVTARKNFQGFCYIYW